jgi:hypothetical protein
MCFLTAPGAIGPPVEQSKAPDDWRSLGTVSGIGCAAKRTLYLEQMLGYLTA